MARHIMPTHMPKSQNKEKMMKIATEKLLCTEEPQYKNILIIHGQKEVQKAVKWHRELKKSWQIIESATSSFKNEEKKRCFHIDKIWENLLLADQTFKKY